MKFYLKLTLLFLFPLFSFAQGQSDAKTLLKCLEIAQKKEKLVLLIISPDYPAQFQARTPVNALLSDQTVVKKAKENFIFFDTKRTDTSIRSIVSTYKLTRFPAYVFMHPNRNVFHVDFGYSSTNHKYLAMLDKAMLMSKEKTSTDLEREYLKNPTNYAVLKQLIDLNKRNGNTNNAELIEKYVQGLKVSDFNNYETVFFVLSSGPYIDGNAYKLAHTDRKLVDSIYKKEPFEQRSIINNAMINNTMASAIRTKNRMRAQSAANFTRNSWGRDYIKANKSYNSQMLNFFKAINDTTSYFRLAIQHYDMYYMNISADSIKKAEEKEKKAALERMRPPMPTNTVSRAKIDSIIKETPNAMVRRTESVLTSIPASNYANELNNIAYQFYQTGTKNLNHLSKAMLWSKRALELNPMWGYYDTLAHVYYAMGIHNEALATQKIAVDLAKKESNPEYFMRATQEYEKMKSKSL